MHILQLSIHPSTSINLDQNIVHLKCTWWDLPRCVSLDRKQLQQVFMNFNIYCSHLNCFSSYKKTKIFESWSVQGNKFASKVFFHLSLSVLSLQSQNYTNFHFYSYLLSFIAHQPSLKSVPPCTSLLILWACDKSNLWIDKHILIHTPFYVHISQYISTHVGGVAWCSAGCGGGTVISPTTWCVYTYRQECVHTYSTDI